MHDLVMTVTDSGPQRLDCYQGSLKEAGAAPEKCQGAWLRTKTVRSALPLVFLNQHEGRDDHGP